MPLSGSIQAVERPELAALRNARGYTQDELGEEIGTTGLTISRYERGASTPQGKRARSYARALNISMPRLNGVLNGDSSGGDDEVGEDDEQRLLAPKWFSIFVAVEQAAARLESYEPHVIHGLLQTEEYARALLEQEHSLTQAERLVRLRMSRQAALVRSDNPLQLVLVISEGAIRLKVGTNALMRRQLGHLTDMAQRENVIVRLLPFAAGPHVADRGTFTLSTPSWDEVPNVAYLETYLSGASYVEDAADIKPFSDLFGRLRSMCLPADQSIDVIRELEEELYQ